MSREESKTNIVRQASVVDGANESQSNFLARTSGRLEPGKSEVVEIKFDAIKEQKFLETIKLEVEDVENHGIKQEEKQIQVDAEAFKITLNEAI